MQRGLVEKTFFDGNGQACFVKTTKQLFYELIMLCLSFAKKQYVVKVDLAVWVEKIGEHVKTNIYSIIQMQR